MKRKSLQLVMLCAILLPGLLLGQPKRILEPIDDSQRVDLTGSVPFAGRPEYDRGPVDPGFQLKYVTLYMRSTLDQQRALSRLLADQQDRSSPSYHRWLTPEQYADSFGLSPDDMETISTWLESHGFSVRYRARGRNWIAFSGTAAQIANAFHTEIHRYLVGGEAHFANTRSPSIPAALDAIVGGFRGLNDFHPKPPGPKRGIEGLRPAYTDPLGNHYLAPGDIATIYDLQPLYDSSIDGTGQTVVIVGQSDIYASDIAAFRSAFGLSNQSQQQWPLCDAGSLCMALTDVDPGVVNAYLEEGELDLEWAGAVARNATIIYAYSDDAISSAFYAIDNDLGPVLSTSYGWCESSYQQVEGSLADLENQAQYANTLGITWVAASGDEGAADCDSDNESQATRGLAVDAPASVPEVTAVGGTEFNEQGGSYWNYLDVGPNGGTATGPIPEEAWNDTIWGTGYSSTLAATGGGVSDFFSAPTWQTGLTSPNPGGCQIQPCRLVPDVALAASKNHDAYIVCYNNVSCFLGFGVVNYWGGGTSFSTPVFGGVLALLNQYLVLNGLQAQAGLGNINPTLYWLAQNSPSAFNDVTVGSNIVPCQIATVSCSLGSFGYVAGPGYDQVTGLGSVNANELILGWTSLAMPKIGSIVPEVPVESSGNQLITVYGNGFQNNLSVIDFPPLGGEGSFLQGPGQIQNVTPTSFQMTIGFNQAGVWGIQVTNPDGRLSNTLYFTVASSVEGPFVSTTGATSISSSGATLGGSVNPNGTDTQVWFQYATNISMIGSLSTPQQDAGSGTSTVPFSLNVSGLANNTTYYFQAAASNSAGASQGSVVSFTTGAGAQAIPPTISTGSVSGVTGSGATLGGTADPNGADTHVWFQYGTNSSMIGSLSTPQQDVGSGTSILSFSFNVSGLADNTTYYFQAVASNSAGTSHGSVVAFTSGGGGQGQAPVVLGGAANNVTYNTAILGALANPNGTDTKVWILYATSSSMAGGFSTAQQDIGAGTISVAFNFDVTGLDSNTTYFLQAWASNSAGTSAGAIVSFTTPSASFALNISEPGTGGGAVTSSPAGINCGSTCTANFATGTFVTLTASPAAGSAFVGWGGACSGVTTCAVTIEGSQTVVADFNLTATNPILAFTPGTISTAAGNGTAGYTGDGGPAVNAELYSPSGAAVDANATIYIADYWNNVIRAVNPATGWISTVAGNGYGAGEGYGGYSGDGSSATEAELYHPTAVAVDGAGNLYIADYQNSRIRVVNLQSGTISVGGVTIQPGNIDTVAGNGSQGYSGDNGPATSAQLFLPSGVTVDAAGNIYIADTENCVVRMVSSGLSSPFLPGSSTSGYIYTVAGNGMPGNSGNLGPSTSAELRGVGGVSTDASGNLYIADTSNSLVRVVSAVTNTNRTQGYIYTVAGLGVPTYLGDGGPGTSAALNYPEGLAVDLAGDVYIADSGNNRIRKLTTATGIINTLAGNGFAGYAGDGTSALSAELNNPYGVAIALSTGNIYIADAVNFRVREVNIQQASFNFGLVNAGEISAPQALTVSNEGNQTLSLGQISASSGFNIDTTTTTCGANTTLTPGASCTLQLEFAPTQVGPGAGTVTLADNSKNSPLAVALSGIGVPGQPILSWNPTTAFITSGTELGSDVLNATATVGGAPIAGSFTYTATPSGGSPQAVFVGSTLPVGVFILTTAFTPLDTADYLSATATTAITVLPSTSSTTTTLTASPNPATATQNVTLTAAVSPSTATGSVNFMDGTTALGSAPLTAGVANLAVSTLAFGPHSLTAVYEGSAIYGSSVGTSTLQVETCASLPTAPIYFGRNGGQAQVAVTASGSCSWTASVDSPWIAVTPPSGSGNGTLTTNVGPYTGTIDQSGNIDVSVGGQGTSAVPVTQRFTAQVFADTVPSYYDFDAVNLLSTEGITNGCSAVPLDFCPTEDIVRSQMAVFIVRAVLHTDDFPYSTTPYFTDVPVGSFGFQWIQKMYELGITNGCGGTPGDLQYCPNEQVTRAQMAVFLIRMRYGAAYVFDYPSTPYFTDVTPATFGWSWIQRMKEDNITSGCGPTTYCPDNPVTRGDMATFVMRGAFNELLPPGQPVLASISPTTIVHGGAPATYTITGINTHFVDGVTTLGTLAGIDVGTVTVVNSTTLTVQLTASSGAALEPVSPLAITGTAPGNEEAVLPNGLIVQ